MPQPIEVPRLPGPAPSDSFYGEPPVAKPSVYIVDASFSQQRRGPCCPDSRGPCDSGGPQSRFSATRAVRGRTRALKVPKASRTRRNIVRGYGPTVSHHGDPGTSRKFNERRPLRPAPGRPYGILARHTDLKAFGTEPQNVIASGGSATGATSFSSGERRFGATRRTGLTS